MLRLRSCAIAFASSAAIALVLASTLAAADGVDSDQDGISDSLENATERSVSAFNSTRGDEFFVSSTLGSGMLQDRFELSYHEGTFAVEYGKTGGPSVSYGLELYRLIEWRDGNGNGRIDDGEGVGWTELGGSAFSGVPVVRSIRDDPDGGRVFNFLIRSPSVGVTLNITMAQRFMRIGGSVLTPMEARMDITLNPIVSDPGASLGLEILLTTEQDLRFEERSWDEVRGFAANERAVNVTRTQGDMSASVFFAWSNTASGAPGTIPVAVTSTQPKSDEYVLYVAYPLASPQASPAMVHHTSLGVQSIVYDLVESQTPEIRGDLPLFAGSVAAVAALVGLTIVAANFRRKGRGDGGRKP